MAQPNHVPIQPLTLKPEDLQDPSLSVLNNFLDQVREGTNSARGFNGPVKLADKLDLGGNPIGNVGAPEDDYGVVTKGVADNNYGPAAIQPSLDWTGKQILQSTRRLNDKDQRESYSSFLNHVMNTAPTTNNSVINVGASGGGTATFGVSAGYHSFVDGIHTTPYGERTDTVPTPTAFTVVSLTRTAGLVTAVVTPSGTWTVNEAVTIAGTSDSSFDGTFVISNDISGTSFQYPQVAPDATSSGGTLSIAGVYYYYIRKNSTVVALDGPFAEDTQSNRTGVCIDGQVLIAVVTVTGSGVDSTRSAAGATPAAQTNGSWLLFRL